MHIWIDQTLASITDLGLKCNGTNIIDGKIPTQETHMDPKQWTAHMERLIASDGM